MKMDIDNFQKRLDWWKSNASKSNPKCKKCGKDSYQTGGWLERINIEGKPGSWECKPSCDAKLSKENRILQALLNRKGT